MATFAELLADVYTLTNRPDLVGDTKLAVKAATLKLHQKDFYTKDLYESGLQFSTSDYVQALEYRTLWPRFRSLKYLRKSDSSGAAGDFMQILTPAQILDRYGYQKEDIAYLAGELIQMKSSTELQYMLAGVYLNPDITENGFNSWIALDHPFAIVYEAAVTIFKAIGYDEQATTYSRLAKELADAVTISGVAAEGY